MNKLEKEKGWSDPTR